MSVTRYCWCYGTLLFLALGLLQPSTLGNSRPDDSKQIEVRLLPKKKIIKAGETLEVRVEIRNTRSETFFIRKDIFQLCFSSPLSLRLELGPPIKPQPGHGCASDCVYGAGESLARRLAFFWTILRPGHFYGAVVSMDADTFPQLNTPGRWRLRGSYTTLADLSSSFCFDPTPIPDKDEQLKSLPYKAWQGEVETNTRWVEVIP